MFTWSENRTCDRRSRATHGTGGATLVHVGTNKADKEGNTEILAEIDPGIQESTEEDEGSEGWTDHVIMNLKGMAIS